MSPESGSSWAYITAVRHKNVTILTAALSWTTGMLGLERLECLVYSYPEGLAPMLQSVSADIGSEIELSAPVTWGNWCEICWQIHFWASLLVILLLSQTRTLTMTLKISTLKSTLSRLQGSLPNLVHALYFLLTTLSIKKQVKHISAKPLH